MAPWAMLGAAVLEKLDRIADGLTQQARDPRAGAEGRLMLERRIAPATVSAALTPALDQVEEFEMRQRVAAGPPRTRVE